MLIRRRPDISWVPLTQPEAPRRAEIPRLPSGRFLMWEEGGQHRQHRANDDERRRPVCCPWWPVGKDWPSVHRGHLPAAEHPSHRSIMKSSCRRWTVGSNLHRCTVGSNLRRWPPGGSSLSTYLDEYSEAKRRTDSMDCNINLSEW